MQLKQLIPNVIFFLNAFLKTFPTFYFRSKSNLVSFTVPYLTLSVNRMVPDPETKPRNLLICPILSSCLPYQHTAHFSD